MRAIPYNWSLNYTPSHDAEMSKHDAESSKHDAVQFIDTDRLSRELEDSSETEVISDQTQIEAALQISIQLIAIVFAIFVSDEEAEGITQELLQAVNKYVTT